MPNLAGVLKEEIRRLARKEVRTELEATRKANARYRKDIAELKRQLRVQERQLATLQRSVGRPSRATAAATESESAEPRARFSPKWLASHRAKLELSAADYAALVGVSPLTIYNWEKGKTRPRAAQLAALQSVRTSESAKPGPVWKRPDRNAPARSDRRINSHHVAKSAA